MSSLPPGEWAIIAHRHPYPLVFLLSWVLSVPWALLHGPVDPKWVASQALGAAVIPVVAGWATLWRTGGRLKAGLWGAGWAAAVLLLAAVWSGR
jgi:hypothetical protein